MLTERERRVDAAVREQFYVTSKEWLRSPDLRGLLEEVHDAQFLNERWVDGIRGAWRRQQERGG